MRGQALGLASAGMMAMRAVGAAAAGLIAELLPGGAAMTVMAVASLTVTAALGPALHLSRNAVRVPARTPRHAGTVGTCTPQRGLRPCE